MTARELSNRMGADEFIEWLAYEQLLDEKFRNRIEAEMAEEASEEEKNKYLMSFLKGLKRRS